MKKFVCPVCGYVLEAETMPEGFVCPVCKVPGSKFKVMEEGKLAAEHELGIYEKTVANNPDISAEDKAYILEQLKANFTGECSEVGMYLCAWPGVAHRGKAIPRSACTGRSRLRRGCWSTLPSSPRCWVLPLSST